jgi:hypothetical protein
MPEPEAFFFRVPAAKTLLALYQFSFARPWGLLASLGPVSVAMSWAIASDVFSMPTLSSPALPPWVLPPASTSLLQLERLVDFQAGCLYGGWQLLTESTVVFLFIDDSNSS